MPQLLHKKYILEFLVAVSVVFISFNAFSDSVLPVKNRIPILFATLAYDLKLEEMHGPELIIGVVSLVGNKNSHREAVSTISVMQAASSKKIRGLPINIISLEVTDSESVERAISKKGVDVLYLCTGLEGFLEAILHIAQQKRMLTLTGQSDYVKKGVAIGVVERNLKPKILVNFKAVLDQGSSLDGRLMPLVEPVKKVSFDFLVPRKHVLCKS